MASVAKTAITLSKLLAATGQDKTSFPGAGSKGDGEKGAQL